MTPESQPTDANEDERDGSASGERLSDGITQAWEQGRTAGAGV